MTYRSINPHALVNVVSEDVPYPIEPSRYVIGRAALGFCIGVPDPT